LEPLNLALSYVSAASGGGADAIFWRGAGHGPSMDGGRCIGMNLGVNSGLNSGLKSGLKFGKWGMKLRGRERQVDVFEEGLSGDPSYSGRGLDEVIAGLAGLFAAESVGKNERFGKLTSAHQKTGAIDGPLAFHIHNAFFHPTRFVFLVVTERDFRSADARFKWSDCTRRKGAGQLHKNCATVEFPFASSM
jgi:hypothetical protein